MNPTKAFLALIFVLSGSSAVQAQKNIVQNTWYTLVVPDMETNGARNNPLLVRFKDQTLDSAVRQVAKNKRAYVLELENSNAGAAWNSDSLKKLLQKIRYEFPIQRDRMYLLGSNGNIRETAEIRTALHYYFAATAFVTTDRNSYTALNKSLKLFTNVRLFFVEKPEVSSLEAVFQFLYENTSWIVDLEKMNADAVTMHYEKPQDTSPKHQISLEYGQWFFDNSARSDTKPLIEFPKNIHAWHLAYARQLSKSLTAEAKVGLLLKKFVPARPDAISVINGAPVDVEGGGIFLMPMSVGLNYSYSIQRFRPYLGFGFGVVPARYTYVEASGNLVNGIRKNEYKFNSNAGFVELSTGFMVRTGTNRYWGLSGDFVQSSNFNESIGGFKAYNGFKLSALFLLVF